MKTKRFAVRIQEGAKAHLKIVEADGPDGAAVVVIERMDCDGDRLLGAKIAVWEHGTLQKNVSPLFIKSIQPYETTPDINVIQALREKARKAKWLVTQELAKKEKERKPRCFEEPYELWLDTYLDEEKNEFFSLPSGARRECIALRDHLKHVSPGQMTDIQARFAQVVSGFPDLYRYEMQTMQEHLLASLEMIHHLQAGASSDRKVDDKTQRERLANLIVKNGGSHTSDLGQASR